MGRMKEIAILFKTTYLFQFFFNRLLNLRILIQKLLHILSTLTKSLLFVREPAATFGDNALLYAQILIMEYKKNVPDEFDYLEGLSESELKEDPIAIKLAESLEISIDFLAANFMHDC